MNKLIDRLVVSTEKIEKKIFIQHAKNKFWKQLYETHGSGHEEAIYRNAMINYIRY